MEQEVYKETSEEELRAMQLYGFGNKRSGVFARLQVRLQSHRRMMMTTVRGRQTTLLMAVTGGTERCDRCQEPRANHGSREEEGPAAGRSFRLLR